MSKRQIIYTFLGLWIVAGAGFLSGCSSTTVAKRATMPQVVIPTLSEEEQNRFDYFYLEGLRLHAKSDFTAAFELFRHCEAIHPYSAEVKTALVPYYFMLGKDSLGIVYQRRAVELEPGNYWYAVQLAGLYQTQKEYPSAIKVYEDIIQRFPDNEDTFYTLIELYPRNGDYAKAIDLLNELEKRVGKSEEISLRKFQLYLYQEKSKEAFREIESLVETYPNDATYRCILGDLYLTHRKYPDALGIFREILEDDPTNEQALLSMADYYEAVQDTAAYSAQVDSLFFSPYISDESKGHLMREIIMKSEDSPIDSTHVLNLFERMLSSGNEDADMMMLYAQYLLTKQMNAQATPVLEKILEMDPSNELVRKQLLSDAIRAGDSRKIVELCKPITESVLESPEDLAFFYYLAAGYYQLDEYDSALSTIRKALENITNEVKPSVVSDFYSMMGDLYHLQKNEKEAYAAYDSALVYNPLNIGALNNYAYYMSESENGDLVKAEKMSAKTIELAPDSDTYLDTYAWILYRLHRYEEARTYIDKALEQGGAENAVELDHAGDIYFELGLKREATAFWKQALEREAENPGEIQKKIKRAEK